VYHMVMECNERQYDWAIDGRKARKATLIEDIVFVVQFSVFSGVVEMSGDLKIQRTS